MARKKGGSAAGPAAVVGLGPWAVLLVAAVVYYLWWFFLIIVGLVALTCYIVVRRARSKVESTPALVLQPAEQPRGEQLAPPPRGHPLPSPLTSPRAKTPGPAVVRPKEAAAPAYWTKWDGMHRCAVEQDKDEWDHAFDGIIENAAERQRKPGSTDEA